MAAPVEPHHHTAHSASITSAGKCGIP
jgi:hypothetical protein